MNWSCGLKFWWGEAHMCNGILKIIYCFWDVEGIFGMRKCFISCNILMLNILKFESCLIDLDGDLGEWSDWDRIYFCFTSLSKSEVQLFSILNCRRVLYRTILDTLHQCFSNFFEPRHILTVKIFCGTPFLVKKF